MEGNNISIRQESKHLSNKDHELSKSNGVLVNVLDRYDTSGVNKENGSGLQHLQTNNNNKLGDPGSLRNYRKEKLKEISSNFLSDLNKNFMDPYQFVLLENFDRIRNFKKYFPHNNF